MKTSEIIKQLIGNGSKSAFAKRHGITRQYLYKWLVGNAKIPFEKLESIAKKEGYELSLKLTKL